MSTDQHNTNYEGTVPAVGDVVLLRCLVTGVSTLGGIGGGREPVVDLRPIESTSGKPFSENVIKQFTVYACDVFVER